MAALEHVYQYAAPSLANARGVHLAATIGSQTAAPFLRARARKPRLAAQTLRLVSDVVRSRHHIPAAMLEKILIEADPILSWTGEQLRVEGFSSCCGVYVRADFSQRAFSEVNARPGTTNVDFRGEMRKSLAQIRDDVEMIISVGEDGVSVQQQTGDEVTDTFEKKVALPLRWIRGLCEVHLIAARMRKVHEFDRGNATRFLREVKRFSKGNQVVELLSAGKTLRVGRGDGSFRVGGPDRLKALEPWLRNTHALGVYSDEKTGATAWVACGESVSITMVLSPQIWRGFSGEGQALSLLLEPPIKLARAKALLSWEATIAPDDVAEKLNISSEDATRILAWLGCRGLVGYDITQSTWFYRHLPFDMDAATALIIKNNPRLAGAQQLIADGALQWESPQEVLVRSKDVAYKVHIGPEQRCTCPWFSKHQDTRGPCKHILAAQLAKESHATA